MYLFINYMNLLEQPIWALTHQVESFQTIGACVERLTELRKIQPKVQDGDRIQLPRRGAGAGFRRRFVCLLSADEPVLRDLSFQLKPGSVLGLLGADRQR